MNSLAEYFDIEIFDNNKRMSSIYLKNLDVLYFLAYCFAVVAFIIKLVTDDERLNSIKKDPLKRNLAALIFFPAIYVVCYLLFNATGTEEKMAEMTVSTRWVVKTQIGVVITSAGMILLSAFHGVYIKWFVGFLQQTFTCFFIRNIRGI